MDYGRILARELLAGRPQITVDASRNLALTDAFRLILINSSTPVTLTFANLDWMATTEIDFIQEGTGTVTFQPAAGVILRRFGSPGTHVLAGQNSIAFARLIRANEWVLEGRFV